MPGRLTTHVLDTAQGRPAAHLAIELWQVEGDQPARLLASAVTNADGRTEVLDVPEGVSDLAGFESWRTTVWGSEAVRSLGAEFFPVLATGDLTVPPEQVPDFRRECAALRADPDFPPTRHAIDDLDSPVGEQNGPWALWADTLIPRPLLREISRRLGHSTVAARDSRAGEEVRRLLRDHPFLAEAVRVLLERGDPAGRHLAVRVAATARTPDLLAARELLDQVR